MDEPLHWVRRRLRAAAFAAAFALAGCGDKPRTAAVGSDTRADPGAGSRAVDEASVEAGPAAVPVPAPEPAPTASHEIPDELRAFVVENASVLVTARPAQLVASGAFQEIVEGVKALPFLQHLLDPSAEDRIAEKLGVEIEQVEFVVLSTNTGTGDALLASLASSAYRKDLIVTKVSELAGHRLVVVESHSGVDLYGPENGEGSDGALAFVTETILAAGNGASVKRSIDNFRAGRRVEITRQIGSLIDSAPPEAVAVAAVADRDFLASTPVGKTASAIDGLLIAVSSGEALDVFARLAALTDGDAGELRTKGRAGVERIRRALGPMAEAPEAAPVMDFLGGITFGGTGRSVEVRATIRPELVRAAPMLTGMAVGSMTGDSGTDTTDDDGDDGFGIEDLF